MRWWIRFRALLPRILRRGQDERDLEDEIRFDLAEELQLRVERGEPPESARIAVRRDFGRVAAVKQEARAAWGWTFPERVVQDLRFALRTLSKSPGFAFAAVLTLALGIGLCSFLFSSLNGMVLRPLPGAREPQRLAALEAPVAIRASSDTVTTATSLRRRPPSSVPCRLASLSRALETRGRSAFLDIWSLPDIFRPWERSPCWDGSSTPPWSFAAPRRLSS